MHCEGSLCHAILFFFSNGAGGLRVISFKIEKKERAQRLDNPCTPYSSHKRSTLTKEKQPVTMPLGPKVPVASTYLGAP